MTALCSASLKACPQVPTKAMWNGLARDIMMWLDFGPRHTPASLLKHLERTGREIPQWLRDEPEMQHLDHSMSKGTRAVLIWRAMWEAAPVVDDEGTVERVMIALFQCEWGKYKTITTEYERKFWSKRARAAIKAIGGM